MNWDAIGAVGELLGAVAVVASLGYLAIQVRQNTSSIHATLFDATSRASSDLLMRLALDREAMSMVFSGFGNYETLEGEERFRFNFVFIAFFNMYETLYYHRERGMVPEELWQSRIARMHAFLAIEGVAAWWENNRSLFEPRFRDFVNASLD